MRILANQPSLFFFLLLTGLLLSCSVLDGGRAEFVREFDEFGFVRAHGGRLYFGAESGFWEISPETGDTDLRIPPVVVNNWEYAITDAVPLSDGIWVGTATDHLFEYDPSNGEFVFIPLSRGESGLDAEEEPPWDRTPSWEFNFLPLILELLPTGEVLAGDSEGRLILRATDGEWFRDRPAAKR